MRSRIILGWFVFFLTVSIAQAGALSIVETDKWVRVNKVFDGDTFRTTSGDKVRLLGINAPEITHHTQPGEPLGEKATSLLKQLTLGKIVRLKTDIDKRDSYGRLLAQVYLRNGEWINAAMLRHGMAFVYTFTPNIRWAEKLLVHEQQARKKRIGIWRNKRFKVLSADEVNGKHIGQFRLVQGYVSNLQKSKYRFRLGKLIVSIPRAYRDYFKAWPTIQDDILVLVHGMIRTQGKKLFLALHSPTDMEKMRP